MSILFAFLAFLSLYLRLGEQPAPAIALNTLRRNQKEFRSASFSFVESRLTKLDARQFIRLTSLHLLAFDENLMNIVRSRSVRRSHFAFDAAASDKEATIIMIAGRGENKELLETLNAAKKESLEKLV